MEYVGQDLNNLFSNQRETLSEENLLKVVYNFLCSLSFLHQANIMHRDLKPANVLITDDYDVKICDFGLSRSVPP